MRQFLLLEWKGQINWPFVRMYGGISSNLIFGASLRGMVHIQNVVGLRGRKISEKASTFKETIFEKEGGSVEFCSTL